MILANDLGMTNGRHRWIPLGKCDVWEVVSCESELKWNFGSMKRVIRGLHLTYNYKRELIWSNYDLEMFGPNGRCRHHYLGKYD